MKSTSMQMLAKRVSKVPPSFIREILKVAVNPDILSFAGGLPNSSLFPVEELGQSASSVLSKYGMQALQYASTEGYYPLREWIAARYKARFGFDVSPNQILITNGSQQALDLISKLLINPGDDVLLERPSYLGALQCFSMYEANFHEVSLEHDGINIDELESVLVRRHIKVFYGIPNYQNPTGISYSLSKRKKAAEILCGYKTIFVEDDPYGELSFTEQNLPPIYSYLPKQTILLGSFSKIIAPGLRLGWLVASPQLVTKLAILKQATDLHSGNLAQYILYDYLMHNNLNNHIKKIAAHYHKQCEVMLDAIHRFFPFSTTYTRPLGGMFCWLTLAEKLSARQLLDRAMKEKIVFVPGDSFYASTPDTSTLRLNFTNAEQHKMADALKKLGQLIES